MKDHGPFRIEQGETELQVIMRAVSAQFWTKDESGRIFIDKPKPRKNRRSPDTLERIEVDLKCLERIKERLTNKEPLQDNEELECLKKSPKKRKQWPLH